MKTIVQFLTATRSDTDMTIVGLADLTNTNDFRNNGLLKDGRKAITSSLLQPLLRPRKEKVVSVSA